LEKVLRLAGFKALGLLDFGTRSRAVTHHLKTSMPWGLASRKAPTSGKAF
jgi:hypothetical protein